MYRRFASHFIYYNGFYRMHYVELDENNQVRGIYPLKEEIAETVFYNGIIIIVRDIINLPDLLRRLEEIQKDKPEVDFRMLLKAANFIVPASEPVALFHFDCAPFSSPKFGTYNSSGNCHIKRL